MRKASYHADHKRSCRTLRQPSDTNSLPLAWAWVWARSRTSTIPTSKPTATEVKPGCDARISAFAGLYNAAIQPTLDLGPLLPDRSQTLALPS